MEKLCTDLEIPYDIKVHAFKITETEVDKLATEHIPRDLHNFENLVAVKVSADGNCLPHTGSYMAFGHEENHAEIRVRIVQEQLKNKKKYMDPEHLRQGITCTEREANLLPNNCGMYSDALTSMKLYTKEIERIYQTEVLEVRKNATYMGI